MIAVDLEYSSIRASAHDKPLCSALQWAFTSPDRLCPLRDSLTTGALMPGPRLIIDGYNLLHAAGLARVHYAPGDLERQRERLLAQLREHLAPDVLAESIIVFDAQDAPAHLPRQAQSRGLTILYSAPQEEADDVIERLVARYGSNRKLVVVSSDHRVQRAARRHRVQWIDSEEFLAQLEGPSTSRPAHAPQSLAPSRPSPTDLGTPEQWLREFGFEHSSEGTKTTSSSSVESVPPAATAPATPAPKADDPNARIPTRPLTPPRIPPAAPRPATEPSPDDWQSLVKDVEAALARPDAIDRLLDLGHDRASPPRRPPHTPED